MNEPYAIHVGQKTLSNGFPFIPDPEGRKAVLVEVKNGACHFTDHSEMDKFIAELQSAREEAFAGPPPAEYDFGDYRV